MRENYQLIVVVVCQIAKLHVIATVIGVYESHALPSMVINGLPTGAPPLVS